MMWAQELEGRARHDPETRILLGNEQPARIEQAARPDDTPRRQNNAFKVVAGLAVWSAIVFAVVVALL